MTTSILIPAYQPTAALIDLVEQLRARDLGPILIVNDGSDSSCDSIFTQLETLPGVSVLNHVFNLGKGAALKTGFNSALLKFPDLMGVITVDADGQHSAKDAHALRARFHSEPHALVLGVREFKDQKLIPWRSRFGNKLTRTIFKLITGSALSDTQTGLRAIPKTMLGRLLQMTAPGYEFETDMLLLAIRENIPIVQHSIETVYIDGNSSSHFNPLIDSLKIYFVLFRFTLNAVATGLIDLVVFAFAQAFGLSILNSSILGRFVAGTFNFLTSRRFVFKSRKSFATVVMRYVLLVCFLLFISNSAISALVRRLDMNILLAKILVEGSLFLLSFSVQRTFVFPKTSDDDSRTDWDAYYAKRMKAASITRRFTIRRILDFISPFGVRLKNSQCLEFGGGDSCVYESLRREHEFLSYSVVDNNEIGLRLFTERAKHFSNDGGIFGDVLNPEAVKSRVPTAALCLSIGLIEHFNENQTRDAIRSHFICTQPGGLVLITYPTPTWLYRLTRATAELLGIWKFHDERPLSHDEVTAEVTKYGKILRHEIIWPILLTQGILICQKEG